MIQINQKNFELYDLDNEDTIIRRIARSLETIPKYLYFKNGNKNFTEPVEVEDILTQIKSFTGNFQLLIENLKGRIDALNIETDVLEPFIAYNTVLEETPEAYRTFIYEEIGDSIKKSNLLTGKKKPKTVVEEIWNKRDEIKARLETSISENRIRSDNESREMYNLQTVSTSITSTDIEIHKTAIIFNFEIENNSIMEIFDLIKLNQYSPFACVNRFYKIYNNFIPPEDWSIVLDDVIILKVLIGEKKYSDVFIYVEDGVAKCRIEFTFSKTSISKEEFILRVKNCFSDSVNFSETNDREVTTVFYFLEKEFNSSIMADLVMNDSFFSNMFVINESEYSSKKSNSISLYFIDKSKFGEARVSISEKVSDKNTELDIPFNQKYLKFRISRIENLELANTIKTLFSKILNIYYQKAPDILRIYKSYIPKFGETTLKQNVLSGKKLKDIVPELFVANYSRKCLKKPTIISEDETKTLEGVEVMKFPKDNSIVEPSNYICSHKSHKYPGLRENSLSNSDDFPYIPCCYVKTQNKPGTRYDAYYNDKIREMEEENAKKAILTTNKFVQQNNFGELPKNIGTVFKIIENNEDISYLRKGVYRNKNSFLNCVMEALNGETNILSYDTKEKRERKLDKTRRSLATDELLSSCRQEFYNLDIGEIRKIVLNPEIYFDPKLFIRMLELEFNCNIILFTRNTVDGEISIPNHLETYYKVDENKDYVFVYEHMGSESDNAKYPQCEIIARWDTTSNEQVDYLFDYELMRTIKIKELFNKINSSYSHNKLVSTPEFNLIDYMKMKMGGVDSVRLESQIIDSKGKVRVLNIKYNNQKINLFTTPLPPFRIREVKDLKINKISKTIALQFIEEKKITILKQVVKNNLLKELGCVLGNVSFYIPVIDTPELLSGVEIENRENFPYMQESKLDNFNKNKKIARFISEYFLWLYSKFLHERNLSTLTNDNIVEFNNSYVVVIKNFDYVRIKKLFSLENGGVISNGKLVLTSEEVLKRLIYMLKLNWVRDENRILNYRNKTTITEYYNDSTDFEKYSFQNIIEGPDSFLRFINRKKVKYSIVEEIEQTSTTPYFFKNELISNNIYLAQNTDTYMKAINICKTWKMKGYNNYYEAQDETINFSFILYSYTNGTTIRKNSIRGVNNPYDIKIVSSRTDSGLLIFTVLLDLE